jgi:hypothetical protein
MSSTAVRSAVKPSPAVASSDILIPGNRLKMSRIHTSWDFAQMINLEFRSKCAVENLPAETMGANMMCPISETETVFAISVLIHAAKPDPAAGKDIGVNFLSKTLGKSAKINTHIIPPSRYHTQGDVVGVFLL